jgi:hypothetical protein
MTCHDAPRFVLRHFLPLASNETDEIRARQPLAGHGSYGSASPARWP